MRKSRVVLEAELASMRHHASILEGQLAQTQEWLERFQGLAAEKELEVLKLQAGAAEDAISIGWFRDFMVDVDSVTSLVGNRYRTGVPVDVADELLRVSGIARRAIKSRGRGETVHAAASKAVDSGPAGSTPAAPTEGAVQVDSCPLCGSARTVQGNVASCLACGGGPW